MQTEDLLKYLQDEFELSETEASLYVGLLKKGPSSIMEISKFTNVNRATTHINIENIISKGLVTQSRKANGKRRIVSAEPPERLKLLLDQKKMKLERAEKGLSQVMEQLNGIAKIAGTNVSEVEVKYYKGRVEVGNIYNEIMKADEIRAYVDLRSVQSVFPENEEKYVRAHKRNLDMVIRSLISAKKGAVNHFAKLLDPARYFYKFFPQEINLYSIEHIMYNNTLVLITMDESPSGVVLKNEALYIHSKQIFDLTWNLIK